MPPLLPQQSVIMTRPISTLTPHLLAKSYALKWKRPLPSAASSCCLFLRRRFRSLEFLKLTFGHFLCNTFGSAELQHCASSVNAPHLALARYCSCILPHPFCCPSCAARRLLAARAPLASVDLRAHAYFSGFTRRAQTEHCNSRGQLTPGRHRTVRWGLLQCEQQRAPHMDCMRRLRRMG